MPIIGERYADFGQTLVRKARRDFSAISDQRDGTQADDTGWFMVPRSPDNLNFNEQSEIKIIYSNVKIKI